jgi:pimeloyl-ACP methyl ester carboxylesterase
LKHVWYASLDLLFPGRLLALKLATGVHIAFDPQEPAEVLLQHRTNANLGLVSRRAPGLAGDVAFRRFCTPALSAQRPANYQELAERARFHLRSARWERIRTPQAEVQTYVFEPDTTPAKGAILLVHGWTAEAAFMTAFAEPLRRSGYRTIAFDFPAHGRSEGRHTNLAACARAMLALAEAVGPIHGAVAHSFGGLVSLLVAEGGPPLYRGVRFERLVLLACPNRLSDVTRDFGAGLRLGPAAQRAYERHIERVGHRSVAGFSAVALLRRAGRPALLLHSRDDEDVPFAQAEQITAGAPGIELVAFEGLGHRRLLYAPPVTRATTRYLVEP